MSISRFIHHPAFRRALLAALPAGLVFVLAVAGGVGGWNFPDAGEYQTLAGYFMEHGLFDAPGIAPARRAPGLPFLLALAGFCVGLENAYILLNCGAVWVMTYCTMHLAECFGWRYRWVIPLVFSLSGGLLAAGAAPLSETVYLAFLWNGICAWMGKKYAWAGLLFGLGTLVRPIGIFLPLLMGAALLPPRPTRRSCIGAALLVLTGFAPVWVWNAHNLSRYGYWQLTSADGLNALEYKLGSYFSWRDGRPFRAVTDELNARLEPTLNPFERDRAAQRLAARLLGENFFGFCWYAPHNLPYFFMPGVSALLERLHLAQGNRGTYDVLVLHGPVAAAKYYFASFRHPFAAVALIAVDVAALLGLYALAAWGWMRLAVRRETRLIAVELLIFGAYFAVLAVGNLDWRFRLPVLPLLALLAVYALQSTRVTASAEYLGTCSTSSPSI